VRNKIFACVLSSKPVPINFYLPSFLPSPPRAVQLVEPSNLDTMQRQDLPLFLYDNKNRLSNDLLKEILKVLKKT